MKFATGTALALVLSSFVGAAQAQDKKVIQSASDIPPIVIELPKKPSELVIEGGPALSGIKDKVEAHAEHLLRDYDIKDASTAKQVRSVLIQVALAENRWADVLRLNEEIRALEEKPAAKAMTGLVSNAYARAAMAVGEDSPQFRPAFKAELEKSVAALDWTVAQDPLQAMRGQYQLMSRDLLIGSLQGGLDANAAAQNMKVGFGMGVGLVSSRTALTEMVPLKDTIFEVLNKRVLAEATQKEDRWTRRLVELKPNEVKKPVAIAIWDGGFDPKVFGDQLWKNGPRSRQREGRRRQTAMSTTSTALPSKRTYKRSTARSPMPAEDLQTSAIR
jgi:hypothetical protein